MDAQELHNLMHRVAAGQVDADAAAEELRAQPVRELAYAVPDTSRGLRTGVSEVIYGAGKTAQQIAEIAEALHGAGQRRVFATRVDASKAAAVTSLLVQAGVGESQIDYHEDASMLIIGGKPPISGGRGVVVCCAGTSDLYCAEEAALTAEMLGSRVTRLFDVGVAGLHRLLSHADEIQQAGAIVAAAGMEGALPSVIAGIAPCPVIAVPTSVGYGASFGGISALLAMLNSCASGVSVVNIDNGFGAGYQAALIDHAGTR